MVGIFEGWVELFEEWVELFQRWVELFNLNDRTLYLKKGCPISQIFGLWMPLFMFKNIDISLFLFFNF